MAFEDLEVLGGNIDFQVKLNCSQHANFNFAEFGHYFLTYVLNVLQLLDIESDNTLWLHMIVEMFNHFFEWQVLIVNLACEVDSNGTDSNSVDYCERVALHVIVQEGQRCRHDVDLNTYFSA